MATCTCCNTARETRSDSSAVLKVALCVRCFFSIFILFVSTSEMGRCTTSCLFRRNSSSDCQPVLCAVGNILVFKMCVFKSNYDLC